MNDQENIPAPQALSESDRREIAEIMQRRANELASFRQDLEAHAKEKFNNFPGCVEMAISREIQRLRGLANKVRGACGENNEEND